MSKKFYSLLLRLYPESHRARFGAEMLQVFEDARREAAGSGALFGFWVRIISDAVVSASAERAAALQANHATRMNAFFKPTIGKVILAATGLIPLFWISLFAFMRLVLLMPHPHTSGVGVLLAFSAVIFVPAIASAAISYLCSCAIAAMFTNSRAA